MASIDKPDPGSSQSSKDGPSTGELRDADTSANASAEPPVPDPFLIKSPASSSSTTTDVSTAPSHQSPAPGSSSSYTAFPNPPPKKFSAVNINKKFLQKTSTNSSAPSASLSNPNTIKTGSSAPRPSTQPSASHSRLVTAKLTSTAPLPATTGSSWSRPSSAAPSATSATPTSSNVHPSQPPVSGSAAPQLPHIGKVVEPQPQYSPASTPSSTKKDGSSTKPVWGTSKPTSALSFTDNAGDFPTAAEVAQGLNAKSEDGKSEVSFLSKQSGEADAFRGVHLDPNAHHWDEMEEDDDNFLDNVIEFGDGRQYKVVPTEPEKAPSDQTVQQTGSEASAEVANHTSSEVVAKEDRFADDFDRRWPRSKFSPTVIQRDFSSRSSRQASTSPASSQPSHSPLESPRVLFNERSNRLEPYSNVYPPARFSGSHGVPKRDGRAEPFNRDPPPHGPASPVQLLQKSAESSTSTRLPRSYLRDTSSSGRYPDRELGPPPASHYGQSRTRGRDAILPPGPGPNNALIIDDVRRRRGSSGAHSGTQVDNTLLLHPPHPSDGLSSHYVQPQGLPVQPSSSIPSGVPPVDSTKTGVASTEVPHQNVPPTVDVETMHKTTMHITAERARQRRQLEEEEREREKERARRKAAELEEQMKASETGRNQSQDSTTWEGIEETIGPLEVTPDSVPGPQMTSPSVLQTTLILEHTRSSRESKFPRLGASSDEPTAPNLAESWRCKTHVSSQRPSSPTRLPVLAPLPLLHAGDEPITSTADENLEVVDFSDLGKLVGEDVLGPHQSSANQSRPRQRGRSTTSEFFEDTPTSQGPSEFPGREVVSLCTESSPTETTERSTSDRQYGSTQGPSTTSFDGFMSSGTCYSLTSLHRPHKNFTSFREPPIAALDDVMSRIKGALDNMQVDSAKEAVIDIADARPGLGSNKSTKLKPPGTTRSLPKEAKWLPPALRSQRSHHDHGQEDFAVTGYDPPHSPRLTPRVVVKFPKVSHAVEPIQKRQLRSSTMPDYVRWDILSWNPPVEGMNKRSFSINDVLFKKFKGHRYQVTLPRSVRTGPRVHIPTMSSRVSPLYGRPKTLDDLVSWRRGPSDTKDQKSEKPMSSVRPLDVISHSPRPSIASLEDLPEPITVDDTSTKLEKQLIRPRNQPKLPPGSAIGFYRNPTLTIQQPNGTVNFTVISELEDGKNLPQLEAISPSLAESSISTMSTNPNTDSVAYEHSKDTESPKTGLSDSKSPEDSTERSLLTPASASFGTPWTKSPLSFSAKDSPARAPDPEHLKAVWSQAADKEPAPAVNSLEGIADDLTSLPFTLQDVKSEDGETPPPTSSAGPSKMSLHDVTRAFQQVPTSSSTSSHRAPPMSPQSASGPITRPSNFSYPTPMQPSTLPVRPPYTAFPSTMLVHSPSPNLYPSAATSPIPRVPVNGPSQVYNQHVWVPMQSPQNPNGTMRPMASPYPTQMMAYPTTNTVHPVYGPSNQNPSTPVNGTVHARGMPMMSPVMHHAAPTNVPMYGGSPVMMHPPAIMPVNHRTPYMGAAPPVRGPVRSDVPSGSPLMQQPHPQNSHPHQAVYGVTPGFNARPWC